MPLWNNGINNLSVYPVAGLAPSIDLHNIWLVPVEPNTETPLFHPSKWSNDFRKMVEHFINKIVPKYDVYEDFRKNPSTGNGKKLAIEELEPTNFQTSWISGYAGAYNKLGFRCITPIQNILRKLNNTPDPQWMALFKRKKLVQRLRTDTCCQ